MQSIRLRERLPLLLLPPELSSELLEPDVDYGADISAAGWLARKTGVPVDFIKGLAALAGENQSPKEFLPEIAQIAEGLEITPASDPFHHASLAFPLLFTR